MTADPVAYFLTFGTYGTWLPGDERGWVARGASGFEAAARPGDESREGWSRDRMAGPPVLLGPADRVAVLRAVLEVCRHRGWVSVAVHVPTNHVHAVTSGAALPERMLADFKAYATRALKAAGREAPARWWRRHGSTSYLWTEDAVAEAVDYVLNNQGEPMARWPGPSEPVFGPS